MMIDKCPKIKSDLNWRKLLYLIFRSVLRLVSISKKLSSSQVMSTLILI